RGGGGRAPARARTGGGRAIQLGPDGARNDRRLPNPGGRDRLMCGIAGIARFDGVSVDRAQIDAMTASIAHRGPDDHGALVAGGFGMGMRRLSIIDLSAAGHPPIFTDDRSVAGVYNGEIYNHRDLRSRLDVDGHVFSGNSDTEVLVHGYEQLGIQELAARLSGMFAFALHDRRRQRLFLVRDGFGI